MSDRMGLAEDWLSSNVRLCELTIGAEDQPEEEQEIREKVFNSSSFPLRAYQWTSVLNSLEVYTQALRESVWGFTTGGRTVAMDQHPTKPSPACGISAEGINRFAHCLAGNILQSAIDQWGTEPTEAYQPRAPRVGPPCDHISGGTDPLEMGPREGLGCRSSVDPEVLSCAILNSVQQDMAGERGSQRPRHRSKSAPDVIAQASQARVVDVFGGWRLGCKPEQGSLSCCSQLQDQNEAEARMDLYEDRVTIQPKRHSCASKELPALGSAGGQETKMEDRSGQRCFPGSPPNTGAPCPLLAHTDFPRKGSLDYPDAPPTTPLLPEMTRSHGSFNRKLKGSLAKEFLPSPPPPTPKYLPCICEEAGLVLRDNRAEFAAQLMRSLSLECSQGGVVGAEEEWTDEAQEAERSPEETPKLLAYASQLSAKIISLAITRCAVHFEAQVPGMDQGNWLQLAAEQWANEVMAISFLELMKEDKTRWPGGNPLVPAKHMAEKWPASSLYQTVGSDAAVEIILEDISPELKSPSQSRNHASHASWSEDLCSFAEQLIADILIQARAELGKSNLGQCLVHDMAKELCNSIVAEAVTIATRQQNGCRRTPGGPEKICNLGNGRFGAMTRISQPSMSETSYSTSSVKVMIRDSVQEATRSDVGLTRACAGPHLRFGSPTGSKLRAFLDTDTGLGMKELQAMLLWATASNLGSHTLQLTVQDVQLQAQFSMLANRAQLVGWTVGDLMTSLWQYCEFEDNLTSSGRSLNDTPLLRYLQEKLVGGDD